MNQHCTSCGRPLKSKVVIKNGRPTTVWVCKSPVCRRYMK